MTLCAAGAVFAACTAARRHLNRPGRRDEDFFGGAVRLRAVWNEGAAFGLRVRLPWVMAASAALLGALWADRRRCPLGAGLILGGGLSNFLERLCQGRVYDYVQFPHAPGRLKRYVYNLADFAIFLGGAVCALRRRRYRSIT